MTQGLIFNPKIILFTDSVPDTNGNFIQELLRRDKIAEKSLRRFLPSLPDQHKVVLSSQPIHEAVHPVQCSVHTQELRSLVNQVMHQLNTEPVLTIVNSAREVISSENMTIIGDYITGCFNDTDKKWKVQVQGNAMLQSLVWALQHDELDVQKRYVFLLVGHNQLLTATKGIVTDYVLELISEVRAKNQGMRIFFSAILPRPIDNGTIKLCIVKFNRFLFAAVQKASKNYQKVKFLA